MIGGPLGLGLEAWLDAFGLCHEVWKTAEPIFVTKNGYGDMVIMSMEAYEHQQIMNEVYAKLATAEVQHEAGMGRPLADILKETSKKYEL